MGYRMESQRRLIQSIDISNLMHDNNDDISNYSIGVYVDSMVLHGPKIPTMIRPIVIIRIVDIETGIYKKCSNGTPAVRYTRPCLLTDSSSIPVWKQDIVFDVDILDAIEPNSLMLFEILDSSTSFAQQPSSSNSNSIFGSSSSLPQQSSMERIAWGFLLPLGSNGKLNIGTQAPSSSSSIDNNNNNNNNNNENINSNGSYIDDDSTSNEKVKQRILPVVPINYGLRHRIQMYACSGKGCLINALQTHTLGIGSVDFTPQLSDTSYENNIFNVNFPAVYLEWRKQKSVAIPGFGLTLFLGVRQTPKSRNLTDNERRKSDFQKGIITNNSNTSGMNKMVESEYEKSIRVAMLARSRNKDEACIIPNKVLNRYRACGMGALVISFSHSGHLLAVAALVSEKNDTTSSASSNKNKNINSNSFLQSSTRPGTNIYALQLIDTDRGSVIWTEEVAHHGPVYALEWSSDDTTLLSCSGDGTLKLWNIACFHPLVIKFKKLQSLLINSASSADTNSRRRSAEGVIIDSKDTPTNILLQQQSQHQQGNQKTNHDYIQMMNQQPQLMQTFTSSSPSVYIYCALFNDSFVTASQQSSSISAIQSEAELCTKILDSILNQELNNFGMGYTQESVLLLLPSYFNVFRRLDACYSNSSSNSDSNNSNNKNRRSSNDIDSNASNINSSIVTSPKQQQQVQDNERANMKEDVAVLFNREFSIENQKKLVPNVLTGGSDGRICVWNAYQYLGEICIQTNNNNSTNNNGNATNDGSNTTMNNSANNNNNNNNNKNNNNTSSSYPAHDARINTMIIDPRSHYLISADSEGDINMWRPCDNNTVSNSGGGSNASGDSNNNNNNNCNNRWYQFLRRIKNDTSTSSLTNHSTLLSHPLHTGVLSLSIHPNKNTPHLLYMSQNPGSLKIVNLSTLRIHAQCNGFTSSHSIAPSYNANLNQTTYGDYCFCRAQYSADGRYIIAGVGITQSNDRKMNKMIHKISVWDSQTGIQISHCSLTDIAFPFPVRSLAWHPTQHVLAVAVAGPDASLVVYCADRILPLVSNTGSKGATQSRETKSASDMFQKAANDVKDETTAASTTNSVLTSSSAGERAGGGEIGERKYTANSNRSSNSNNDTMKLSAQAKEIMMKLKAEKREQAEYK